MGIATPVLEILIFLSVSFKFPFPTRSKIQMIQKIYASRGGCEIHANKIFKGVASTNGDFPPFHLPPKEPNSGSKIMHVEVDVKICEIILVGMTSPVSKIFPLSLA